MNLWDRIEALQAQILKLQRELAVLRATETAGGMMALQERAEPDDPAEGDAVVWRSNGTGAGDAGDLMYKTTEGAVTKTGTVTDFSAM